MIIDNTVLTWKENEKTMKARVLYCEQKEDIYVLIDLAQRTAMPFHRPCSFLESGVASGLVSISVETPATVDRHESMFSEADRQYRNRAYAAIKHLVEDPDKRIFNHGFRGALIYNAAKTAQPPCHISSIYNWLTKYWQRGQTPDALLPNFYRCGGAQGARHNRGGSKIGKPVTKPFVTGKNSVRNVDIKDEKIFEMAIKKYIIKQQFNAATTYIRVVEQYYTPTPKTGLPKQKTSPPSKSQFIYYFNKKYTKGNLYLAKYGDKKFQANARPVLGAANKKAFGPGSIYLIDSTIANINLLHTKSNDNIGRPIVFLMVDVFSHLITGVHVTLEYASYNAAAITLWNAIRPKVAFCKEYKYDLEPDYWPAQGIPHSILADRAELISAASDTIIQSLGVTLANAPAYRPDVKGLVERAFKELEETTIDWLDGAVTKERTPGEKKCRDDAKYNLEQFTRILIRAIVLHNSMPLSKYSELDEMGPDHLSHVPTALWRWGMENKTGQLSAQDPDLVRIKLLPVGKASQTESGLCFNNLYYSTDSAAFTAACIDARLNKRKDCTISYNPHCVDEIYQVGDKPGATQIYRLTNRSNEHTRCSWAEVFLRRKEDHKRQAPMVNDHMALRIKLLREQEKERLKAIKSHKYNYDRKSELDMEQKRSSKSVKEAARNTSEKKTPDSEAGGNTTSGMISQGPETNNSPSVLAQPPTPSLNGAGPLNQAKNAQIDPNDTPTRLSLSERMANRAQSHKVPILPIKSNE
jgi:hypothetical protein